LTNSYTDRQIAALTNIGSVRLLLLPPPRLLTGPCLRAQERRRLEQEAEAREAAKREEALLEMEKVRLQLEQERLEQVPSAGLSAPTHTNMH